MLRLALAGCGEHSRSSHAAPLARYAARQPGEIELVAACDLNLSRATEFCNAFGFRRAYTNLDEMLDTEKVDGCVCVMPIDNIVKCAVDLFERRIPCVIEKPLGSSLPEVEWLAKAAQATQTPHMVSVNRRFMPFLNQAKKWTSDAGTVEYVRATQVRDSRSEPDFIWSTAVHVIDALRHLIGEIENFDVRIQRGPTLSTLWYLISLRFLSGATGHVEIFPTAGMVEESYELFGDGFRARVTAGSGPQRSLECWQSGQLVINAKSSDEEPEDLRNGAYQEVETFVRALRSGARPAPEVEDILPSVRICFAIADSTLQRTSDML